MNKNNNFKNVLKEANRYDEVINILNKIIKDNKKAGSVPVAVFIGENGKAKCDVDGRLVAKEAKNLLVLIDQEVQIKDNKIFDLFSNLHKYVNSHTDDLLHNYAISISHTSSSIISMESIRPWLILDNLIDNLVIIEDISSWHIPEGWRKIYHNKNYQNMED